MSNNIITTDSNNINYLTTEQVKSKETEHGFVWMAFFRFENDKYTCDGLKVNGRWQHKGKICATWEEANSFLESKGYFIKYAESPLSGMALAVNQRVIAVYIRTQHPKLASFLAKKTGVDSLQFARFNKTGKDFIGWDPYRFNRQTRVYTIDRSIGTFLIGPKGVNAIEFTANTQCKFGVRDDKVTLSGVDRFMDRAEEYLLDMIKDLTVIATPSLCDTTATTATPVLTGWAKMAENAASASASASSSSDSPPTHTHVKVVVSNASDKVTSVKRQVPENVREVFTVPSDSKIGALIGPKGSHLRVIQKFTQCKIDIVNNLESEPSVVISNPSEEVRKNGYQVVLDFLQHIADDSVPSPIPLYTFNVLCPAKDVGRVMGARGKRIQELRETTMCRIMFDDQANIFTVSSFVKENVTKGIKAVQLAVIRAGIDISDSDDVVTSKSQAGVKDERVNRFADLEDLV